MAHFVFRVFRIFPPQEERGTPPSVATNNTSNTKTNQHHSRYNSFMINGAQQQPDFDQNQNYNTDDGSGPETMMNHTSSTSYPHNTRQQSYQNHQQQNIGGVGALVNNNNNGQQQQSGIFSPVTPPDEIEKELHGKPLVATTSAVSSPQLNMTTNSNFYSTTTNIYNNYNDNNNSIAQPLSSKREHNNSSSTLSLNQLVENDIRIRGNSVSPSQHSSR